MIHISLSTAGHKNYIPKARPFDDDPLFWEKLRGKEKEPSAMANDWLELDLYERSKLAVEKLVSEGIDTALKPLIMSGDVRREVYRNVIDALKKEKLLPDYRKYQILCTTMQILEKDSQAGLKFTLSHSSKIRSALSDLLKDGGSFYQTAYDFMTRFTDFVKVFQLQEDFLSCAISPDGTSIVSGLRDGTVRIWDAETGRQVGGPLQGKENQLCSVAFSPDGMSIVSGSDDGMVQIWDAKTGGQVGEPLRGHIKWVWSVAFSPDGKRIVSGSGDRTVRIWDVTTGGPVGDPLRGHIDWVWSVAFSPDGTHIVSGSYDKTIRIWDARTGIQVKEPLCGHTDWVCSVAFSPDGERIVSGSRDETIRIWDAKDGKPVGEKPLEGHRNFIWSVAFSPDGRRIVSGSSDGAIRIWVAETSETWSPVAVTSLREQSPSTSSVAFSSDGALMISGSTFDRTIRIWDVEALGMQALENSRALPRMAAYD